MSTHQDQYLDLLKKCLTASIYEESSWSIIEATHEAGPKSPLQKLRHRLYALIVKVLWRRAIILVKLKPFSQERRDKGLDWPCFGYTMTGRRRLDALQACIEDVLSKKVPGDFIETGVWRGGTSIFMRAMLKVHDVGDRTVWAADSFEGMPVPVSSSDGADLHHLDYLRVSLEQVKANFARFDLLDDQVRFLKGWFCDSLPKAPVEKLAILRLDGDMYSSTMDSLTNLYHKVSVGGYVIVDDYFSWEPCQRAVADFLKSRKLTAAIKDIDGSAAYWQVESPA